MLIVCVSRCCLWQPILCHTNITCKEYNEYAIECTIVDGGQNRQAVANAGDYSRLLLFGKESRWSCQVLFSWTDRPRVRCRARFAMRRSISSSVSTSIEYDHWALSNINWRQGACVHINSSRSEPCVVLMANLSCKQVQSHLNTGFMVLSLARPLN
jgi:hypothetical protein